MKYIVITSKHHDGFAMFKSKASSFNIVDATPFKRDILKELADACARQGMPLGFYYSQSQDWHEQNGAGNDWDFGPDEKKDYDQYLRGKAEPQVRELLTGYGPVALIWFDTPRMMTGDRPQRFADIVRSLQPNTLIDGRLGPRSPPDGRRRRRPGTIGSDHPNPFNVRAHIRHDAAFTDPEALGDLHRPLPRVALRARRERAGSCSLEELLIELRRAGKADRDLAGAIDDEQNGRSLCVIEFCDLAFVRLSVADLRPKDAPLRNHALGGVLVFVERNADQAKAAILVFPIELFEQRNLRRTDGSSRGPEHDHDRLSEIVRERNPRPIHSGSRKQRRRLAGAQVQ